MSSKEDKDFSLVISSTLDNIGFKKENVILRSKFSLEQTRIVNSSIEKNSFGVGSTMIHAGSSAEGVQLSDSDNDAMCVLKDIVCLDHGDVNENNLTVLATDYTNTAPGYTKVVSVCESKTNIVWVWLRTDCCFGRSPYMSSKVLKQNFAQIVSGIYNVMRYEGVKLNVTTNGPAMTNIFETKTNTYEVDWVFSIYFYGDKYLRRWANRTRNYTWPSKDIIKEISEMEGYIVPVGDKQSENQDFEWRICFTTAEKKLVSHLSDTQIKLYVLLKLLSKHVLKPVCKALTSYVVKNVVFWITETTPQEVFSPDNLVYLVLKSLHFIKHCLENNHFPNYMIPERNLLRGAVCGPEKVSVIKFLSECLTEGRHVILRIPKLKHCMSLMVKHPESMVTYGTWRDEVEKRYIDFNREVVFLFDLKLFLNPDCIRKYPQISTEACLKLFMSVAPPAEWLSMILKGKSEKDLWEFFEKRMKLINFL